MVVSNAHFVNWTVIIRNVNFKKIRNIGEKNAFIY